MRRTFVTAFGRSVRLHHWLASDDQRFMHDHAWDYAVLILWGGYVEHTLAGQTWKGRGSWTRYKAEQRHTVETSGCWSLVFSGKPRRHWGFWITGRDKLLRPLRYFSRVGHHPCAS